MPMIWTRCGPTLIAGCALALVAATGAAAAREDLPTPALDRVTASGGASFVANLRQTALGLVGAGTRSTRVVYVTKDAMIDPKVSVQAVQGSIERLPLTDGAD